MPKTYKHYKEGFRASYQDRLQEELQKKQHFHSRLEKQDQPCLPTEVENPMDYFRPKYKLSKQGGNASAGLGHYYILNDWIELKNSIELMINLKIQLEKKNFD